MSQTEVIGTLKRHFSTHGIPSRLQSDNGPPYSSHEFQQFMTSYDIEHLRITHKVMARYT